MFVYAVYFFIIAFLPCFADDFCESLLLASNPEVEDYSVRYAQQAEQWVATYLVTPDKKMLVSDHDIQLINTLLYFSYARSLSTVDMQKKAVSFLTAMHQSWANIIRTRRNPTRAVDYRTIDRPAMSSDIFFEQLEQHMHIGAMYANITQQLVHEHALETTLAERAVETVRSQARLVVSIALLDISAYTDQLYNLVNKSTPQNSPLKKNRLSSFLMNTVPFYAQHSFTTLDNLCETATQKISDTFSTIAQLNTHIWHTLEVARAAFYLAHYRALNQKLNLFACD